MASESLADLDAAEPPAPPPVVDGAAAPEGPHVAAGDPLVPPRRGRGRPPGAAKKLSGAARRKMKAEAAAAAGGPAAPPSPGGAAAPPPPPPPAKAVDDAGLRMAREVVDDPNLLNWIEGLYRMPFELWASAVKVPEVVPSDAKIERTARLIRQAMIIFGVREWMKYLPLVFLMAAVAEDVAHGFGAIQKAKKDREHAPPPVRQGRQDAPVQGPPPAPPVVVQAPPPAAQFPGMPTPVFNQPSGPLPPGDPA